MTTSPSNSPFTKRTSFYHRVLLVGAPGVGKTPAALSFPSVALYDTESGAQPYRDNPTFNFSEFEHAGGIPTYDGLMTAARWLLANKHSYQTAVVDSISTIVDWVKLENRNAKGELTFQGRAYVNDKMKSLYAVLTSLPLHLVVTARREVQYKLDGREFKAANEKADADKMIMHAFHHVLYMQPDGTAIVWKARGLLNPPKVLKAVNYEKLQQLAALWQQGARLWSLDDIRAQLSTQFNADQHLINTVEKLQREGALTNEMTALQAVEVVREYVARNHPERTAWHKDVETVHDLDVGLQNMYGMTLEQFYANTKTTQDDWESAAAVLERAETLANEV